MRFSYHRGLVFLLIIFIFCLGTGPGRSYADQVFLTNGDRISGSLITFSPTGVQISSPHSGTIHIERQYVQGLATDDRVVVELLSGERIIGRIMPGEGVTVVVQSDVLGNHALALEAVKAIHHIFPDEPPRVKAAPDPLPSTPKTSADKSAHHNDKNLLSAQLQDVRGKGTESQTGVDKPAATSTDGNPSAQTNRSKAGR